MSEAPTEPSMEPYSASHPSPAALAAFSLGKLDDDSARALAAHLEHCGPCRSRVESQSGDDFLARLRLAHSLGATPAPARSKLEAASKQVTLQSGLVAESIIDLPGELANHPQYEVVRELGRGGMGVVYLARNRLMNRQEVLKVLNPRMLAFAGGRERFLREIQSAAQLHHPNIVTAYSVLAAGQLLVFAMEYIPGEDLAKLVAAHGPVPVPLACTYIQQAALGLQHAFEKNTVHRDIKPQNLILCQDAKKKVVKILDFGLAKVRHDDSQSSGLTGTGQAMGTPEFMAPEQCLDASSADIRADIYSLGCTLYFLLSGTAPFQGKSMYEIFQAHQLREAKPLNRGRADVPVQLNAIVRKMMAKKPEHRYQTPLQVAQALSQFVKPSSSEAAGTRAQAPSTVKPQATVESRVNPSTLVGAARDTELNVHKTKQRTWLQRVSGVTSSPHFQRDFFTGTLLFLFALIPIGYYYGAAVIRYATNKGEIVIEVDSPEVEITVKENGVVLQDRPGQREITLSAGDHALEVAIKEPSGETSFVTKRLTLKRGGKEIIQVQHQLAKRSRPREPGRPVTTMPSPSDVVPMNPAEADRSAWQNQRPASDAEWQKIVRGVKWTVLRPDKLESSAGATLTKLEDDSILVSGPNSSPDIYTVTAATKLEGITAIRLEALTHASLPFGGPGRANATRGNFDLTGFRLKVSPADDPANAKPAAFANAIADFSQSLYPIEGAIQLGAPRGWGIHPQEGMNHEAVFLLREPLSLPGGIILTFSLEHYTWGYNPHNLGRFRLSVTSSNLQSQAFVPTPRRLSQAKPSAGKPFTLDLGDGVKMEFALIPAGEFLMGKPDSEPQAREGDPGTAPSGWKIQEERKERPSHRVTISNDFYMAIYPVTQAQYKKIMGLNPSHFSATGPGRDYVQGMDTDRFPVEMVSWHEAQEFCRRLSNVTGQACTLPTEAQWEYACRGGTTTPFYFGTSCNATQANCNGNYPFGTQERGPYLGRTCLVGSYPANPFGLYDMCGNVCQWCQDYCDAQPYNVSRSVDPPGPAYGPMRVQRGGAWDHEAWGCRSAYRAGNAPGSRYHHTGFRVVLAPRQDSAWSGTLPVLTHTFISLALYRILFRHFDNKRRT